MKSYVYHLNGPEGWGWYVYLVGGSGETVDVSGPWPDEYDAEMAAKRAEDL